MGALKLEGEPYPIIVTWNGSPREAPPGLFDYWKWVKFSFCIGTDSNIFFNGRTNELAKTACNNCPVKKNCLVQGLIYKEEGIWGGTTTAERKEDFEESYIQALIERAKSFKLFSPRPTAKEILRLVRF